MEGAGPEEGSEIYLSEERARTAATDVKASLDKRFVAAGEE